MMKGFILLALGLLSTAAAHSCDISAIGYSNRMEREGFWLTPLSKEQKEKAEVVCEAPKELVYLPPGSDTVVNLNLTLKCSYNPDTSTDQFRVEYVCPTNGTVISEWRAERIVAACRREVCASCQSPWNVPLCGTFHCPIASTKGSCTEYTCDKDRIKVNGHAATIGRAYCKRTGVETFEWYFEGEPVRTAECVKEVPCPPLRCHPADCSSFLTAGSSDVKCANGRSELRVISSGVETTIDHMECNNASGAWRMHHGGKMDEMPIGSEVRCAELPKFLPVAMTALISLTVAISIPYLLFTGLTFWRNRKGNLRSEAEIKKKLDTPPVPPPPPAIVEVAPPPVVEEDLQSFSSSSSDSSEEEAELTPEQQEAAARQHDKELADAIEKILYDVGREKLKDLFAPEGKIRTPAKAKKPIKKISNKKKHKKAAPDDDDASSIRKDDSRPEKKSTPRIPSKKEKKEEKKGKEEKKLPHAQLVPMPKLVLHSLKKEREQEGEEEKTQQIEDEKTAKEEKTQDTPEVTEKTQADEKTVKEKGAEW